MKGLVPLFTLFLEEKVRSDRRIRYHLVARFAHSASNGSSIIALLSREVFECEEEEDGGRSREE